MKQDVPAYYEYFNPTLDALKQLGGSGSISEIEEQIVESMNLSTALIEIPHGETNQTEVAYRIAWARTYLKKVDLIQNSSRGVWSLTELGRKTDNVNPDTVKKKVRAQRKKQEPQQKVAAANELIENEELPHWETKLLSILKEMQADAFERLCQRILRESGFIEVEVTGRSHDGGIDGKGILRLNGLISFTVLFQSKRYKDAVGASVVRDFRGALVGRADKGLVITTGRFTREATKEATRDGAPPIDLIDGRLLVRKLKELELGVTIQMIESVEISEDWFQSV